MSKFLVKSSVEYLRNDRKVIRLTFVTSFFHSLIASIIIILNVNTLFAKNYENGLYVGKVAEFFVQEINNYHVIHRVMGIAIVTFILYAIIYPIGQSAIIHYFNTNNKSIYHALKKGKEDFFPMFKYGIVSLVFSPTVFRLIILKILVSGGIPSIFETIMLIIRFIVMMIINCLKVYTRYIISIKNKNIYDAIIQSYTISIKHFKESFKYIRIETFLLINFIINMIIMYAIPIFLIYLAIISNLINYEGVKRTVYGIFFFGIIFGAYASSIIRAFFAYFRREIYNNYTKKSTK